ncbi:MAG TPA: hypothetical protein VGJ60_34030 [Chloroflexota bacterium]
MLATLSADRFYPWPAAADAAALTRAVQDRAAFEAGQEDLGRGTTDDAGDLAAAVMAMGARP